MIGGQQLQVLKKKYNAYHERIGHYVDDEICFEELKSPDDYIPGTEIPNYSSCGGNHQTWPEIEKIEAQNQIYEEEVLNRLSNKNGSGLVVLIGSIGSGKTTTSMHLVNSLKLQPSKHQNSCRCSECPNPSIYIDYRNIQANSSTKIFVLRRLRNHILDRLISCWLGEVKNDLDNYCLSLFKNLLQIFTIRIWASTSPDHEFPESPAMSSSDIAYVDILQYSQKKVANLAIEYMSHFPTLSLALNEALSIDPEKNELDLTGCVLGYYLSHCKKRKSPHIIIIDNLDQLPTSYINKNLNAIYSISTINKNARFLVPLRPSSIKITGYTNSSVFTLHWSPCCFRMMYHRIIKYILGRSKKDIYSLSPSDGLPIIFLKEPSSEEVNTFLFVSYVYVRILAKGIGGDINLKLRKDLHKDHRYLLETSPIPDNSLNQIQETMRALIGNCGRQAIVHTSRFYKYLYRNLPETLELANNIVTGKSDKKKFVVHYRDLIQIVLFDSGGQLTLGRCLNLFQPMYQSSTRNFPSLVKLRILTVLKKSLSHYKIEDIVSVLALYGIPSEVTINALNSLHEELYRLIWFSENHEIDMDDIKNNNHAMISEQGRRYVDSLINDFDYLWACSTEINKQNPSKANFHIRIHQYVDLMKKLLNIEQKQTFFRFLSKNEAPLVPGSFNTEPILTLTILYSTVIRATESSYGAFRTPSKDIFQSDQNAKGADNYINGIFEHIKFLIELIDIGQQFYQICFGNKYYISIYEDEIRKAIQTFYSFRRRYHKTIVESGVLDPNKLDRLISTWVEDLKKLETGSLYKTTSLISHDGSEDLITKTASFARNFIPKKYLAGIDDVTIKDIYKDHMLQRILNLKTLMEKRIPRYCEMRWRLTEIIDSTNSAIIKCEKAGAAVGTNLIKYLKKEKDWWSDKNNLLEANEYSIDGDFHTIQVTDHRKRKYNNLLAIYSSIYTKMDLVEKVNFSIFSWS